MREIITVHLGQAGIQMGNAVWELLCLEHGMRPNGITSYEPDTDQLQSLGTIFNQIKPHEKFVPRTIFADLEPTVIDEVRTGAYKDLYCPDSLLAGSEDAAGNFARGYYTLGCKVVGALVNCTRRVVEACDQFQGFLNMSSLGGGTGSGLLSMFQERLCTEFAGKRTMQFSLIPSSKLAAGPVEVYNTAHHMYRSADFCDINCIFDNSALYEICTNQLSILRPTYTSVNRVISPLIAGVTATMRFKCQLNAHITEYLTNLVPFPRAHFPMLSFAPFCTDIASERDKYSTEVLTRLVFNRSHRTISANLADGIAMATCMTYRGDHSIADVAKVIQKMRNDYLSTVSWCPTGYKIAYTPQPQVSVPGMGPQKVDRSVVMLTNNTTIAEVFGQVDKTFMNLFNRRAFLHWYVGEGMEEAEFVDAHNALLSLVNDLVELENGEESRRGTARMTGVSQQSSTFRSSGLTSKTSKSSLATRTRDDDDDDSDYDDDENDSHCRLQTQYPGGKTMGLVDSWPVDQDEGENASHADGFERCDSSSSLSHAAGPGIAVSGGFGGGHPRRHNRPAKVSVAEAMELKPEFSCLKSSCTPPPTSQQPRRLRGAKSSKLPNLRDQFASFLGFSGLGEGNVVKQVGSNCGLTNQIPPASMYPSSPTTLGKAREVKATTETSA
uniref:Tubulin alpha-2 chain n=1 Tax=Schistocephalus solidus TaxID=70667 RepID=A0A0X3PNG3_SCHSO